MRARSLLSIAVPLALLSGCIERASLPPVRQGVDVASKQRIYEDFKLTHDKTFFSEQWARRDGTYNIAELEDVIDAYAPTRDVKRRLVTRRFVIATVGGVGAGILAGTLAYNLTTDDAHRMSSSTQTTLYVTGGSLFLAGIVMQIAWRDPAEDLAEVYNQSLAGDLGVAPYDPSVPAGPPPVRQSMAKPRFAIAPAPIVGPSGSVGAGLEGALTF